MTTNERLLAEAQKFWEEWVAYSSMAPSYNRETRFAAAFHLSQLRALKESGHLRCKDDCDSRKSHLVWTGVQAVNVNLKLPCSCGGAERFGDL